MMTEHDNADEVTRLRAEVEDLRALRVEDYAKLDEAFDRAHRAEDALTRVRAEADALDELANELPTEASGLRLAARSIRAALDPASPATRPSPAPADDEGAETGAAPSEGHSEAQGAPVLTERNPYPVCVCVKCGPPYRDEVPDWRTTTAGSWMPLCPTCGNKRCPGAADHRHHPAPDPMDGGAR